MAAGPWPPVLWSGLGSDLARCLLAAKEDYEIPAVVVEEGGGIGWVIHPMGAADAHPCDWNPAATGQHCDYTSCPRCGAPWYAADGACPCACGNPDPGGFSGSKIVTPSRFVAPPR